MRTEPAVEVPAWSSGTAPRPRWTAWTYRRPRPVTAVLGPNGAGKTTTVEICEGYRRPDAGTVRVLGLDPVAERGELRPRIGVMLQSGGVYPGAHAEEMLRHIAACTPDPLDPARWSSGSGLGSCGRTDLPAAVRRAAAAARAGDGRRRPARAGLPRRADRRAWTRRPGTPPGTWCASCAPTASPWCSPRTSWTRPSSSPTRWRSSTAAGSSPRAPPRSCAGAAPRTPCASPGRPGLDLVSLLNALPAGTRRRRAVARRVPHRGQGRPAAAGHRHLLVRPARRACPTASRCERRTLEDVFLELTGRELRA